jgi:hypothetical protein
MGKANAGALWHNTQKEKGDRRPEYQGKISIHGEEYYISAWQCSGQGNQPVISIVVNARVEPLPHMNKLPAVKPATYDPHIPDPCIITDDDIPF